MAADQIHVCAGLRAGWIGPMFRACVAPTSHVGTSVLSEVTVEPWTPVQLRTALTAVLTAFPAVSGPALTSAFQVVPIRQPGAASH